MVKRTVWAAFGLLLMVALQSQAAIRYVSQVGSGAYTTLNAAYGAAVSGDTILIGPGTYNEAGVNSQKKLMWLGAGWDQTIINWSSSPFYINTSTASGTVIEGLKITFTNNEPVTIVNGADSITIRRCYLEKLGANSNFVIVASNSTSRLYVEDCILIQNAPYAIIGLPNATSSFRSCVFVLNANTTNSFIYSGSASTGTTELYNNVFLNARTIFSTVAGVQPIIAINNVFYDWGSTPTFGTYPVGSTFDYNASQTIAAPGSNAIAIAADPFVNYDEMANYVHGVSDLHLAGGSALIDAGHPSLLDTDLSRSDCGVYGGPRPLVDNGVPNYPWAVAISLSPNLVGQGTPVNASAIGRVGPQY